MTEIEIVTQENYFFFPLFSVLIFGVRAYEKAYEIEID